jgi:hypothetical protein
MSAEDDIECPLLKRKIPFGYCFELCNIATDVILLPVDKGKVSDWDKAQNICKQCGVYNE